MDLSESILGGQFCITVVVNDGQVALTPGMLYKSTVIRAHAIAEAQREQAALTNQVFINLPGTAQDFRTLERYALHEDESTRPFTGGFPDLATLMTVTDLAVKLQMQEVAEDVAFDIQYVLKLAIDNGGDVRDYPWIDICHVVKKSDGIHLLGGIASSFFRAARATRSLNDALWACHVGQTIREETGFPFFWVYGLYLCVSWGAFGQPTGPKHPLAAVHSGQIALAAQMDGLAIPHLCEVHDHGDCVGTYVRFDCEDHWRAVWRQAHQVASGKLYDEYTSTSLCGPERDVLRMSRLIYEALEEIRAQSHEPSGCDLMRFRAARHWLWQREDIAISTIKQLG
jgi:hypothetical protein